MRYIKLGQSDLNISQIGLGGFSFGTSGWMVGTEAASVILKRALDLGINYIDTANVYSKGESESIIGKITGNARDELIISSKFGGPMDETHRGFSRKEAKLQLSGSLKRLKTDYVDIYMPHTWFEHLDAGEMVRTMNHFVESGQTHYYGLSNPTAYQLVEADTVAKERGLEQPQIVQSHFNAVYREEERDVVPYCLNKSITFSPFSPLAAGFLTGKYQRGKEPDSIRSKEYKSMKKRYFSENDFDILDAVREIGTDIDASPAAVSLAYLLQKKLLPIVGISNPDHLEDVQRSFEINLKEEHIDSIEKIYKPHVQRRGTAGY